MTEIPQAALDLVAEGRIIEAIQVVREHTGLGLKESKEIVDRIERGEIGPDGAPAGPSDPEAQEALAQRVIDLVEAGRQIEAIKTVREATGSDLRDAKAVVDRLMGVEPASPSAPASAPGVAIGLAVALALLGLLVFLMMA